MPRPPHPTASPKFQVSASVPRPFEAGTASPIRAALTDPGAILLLATYELGHQPLTLAAPLATLRDAGFAPVARDTSVDELDGAELTAARLVAIATPMHTALRLGMRVAERARALNPGAVIVFYGLYAALNAEMLLTGPDHLADAVAGGEYQRPLLTLAQALDAGAPLTTLTIPGLTTAAAGADGAALKGRRTRIEPQGPGDSSPPSAPRSVKAGTAAISADKAGSPLTPARDPLPGLERYARLARGGETTLAGYVETTRGCLHTCLHCPITPVYGGRFYINPRGAVLADIRQQVAAGAGHITFGDPDFFNGPGHSMAIARALRAEFPDVTFDVTIKVEHLIERRALVAELAALGCAFVVSAVESLSPTVLARLAKGHTRADVVEALRILEAARLPMRPTFVAFTPWTTAADYLDVLDFIAAHDLVEHVDPIQYAIRLLVPPGSALLEEPDAAAWFGALDPETLSHTWSHPDSRMDALQRAVATLVEREAAAQRTPRQTFAAIRALAARRLAPDYAFSAVAGRAKSGPVPHLTEAWFC